MTEQEEVAGALPAEEKVGSGGTASVGQRLRAAREAAGKSVADVAQALRYSARQVELLEADDYAALPGATVVRGFTRSYARLLGLDAGELLRQLDATMPSALADVRPPTNMGVAVDNEGGARLSPLASAAIVLVLAALLLALWHFFGPKPGKPAGNSGRSAMQVQPQPQEPVQSAPGQSAVLPSEAKPADGVGEAPPTAGPQLVFEFDDRSWIEVVDGDKRVLHSGENPAGSRLTLTGKPPFDIVVGNAGKVRLSYNERVVDLAPHTRAEVARLRLE